VGDNRAREAREAIERMCAELSSKTRRCELRRKVDTLSRGRRRRVELGGEDPIDAAQEKARKAEAEARTGREEARRAAEQTRGAEAEIAELRRKAEDADKRADAAEEDLRRKAEEIASAADAIGRAEALEREVDEIRAELLVARGEADGALGEVDRRTADLKKRVADLEAANAKNEERVVKAYQKIKADEKVRDKVRKALAIAAQLLERLRRIPPTMPVWARASSSLRAAGRAAGRPGTVCRRFTRSSGASARCGQAEHHQPLARNCSRPARPKSWHRTLKSRMSGRRRAPGDDRQPAAASRRRCCPADDLCALHASRP
jgi:hypothetical protein